jgi:hypothetical protein
MRMSDNKKDAFEDWINLQSTIEQSAAYKEWLRAAFNAGVEAAARNIEATPCRMIDTPFIAEKIRQIIK